VVALLVSLRGITNEGAVSLQGDMPRYMMNGVFLYDFVASGGAYSFSDVLGYAQRYYARYPALSLGHHPPLLPVLLVPAYAVLGVSVFAARLVIVVCFLMSGWLLFSIARRLYDDVTGAWATLLFVTSPFLVEFSQSVMSEMPTILFVLLAMRCLLRFRDSGRPRDYGVFVLVAVASLFAKQVAVFVFPAYLLLLSDRHGRGLLLRRDILSLTLGGALLILPVVVLTLLLSPFNVDVVVNAFRLNRGLSSLGQAVRTIVGVQVGPALAFVTAAGIVAGCLRRDKKISLALIWMLAVASGVVLLIGPYEPERYSVAALPAYCLCAAVLATVRSRVPRQLATLSLVAAVGWQVWSAQATRPVGAAGYEAAARYVLAGQPSASVLFSGSVDTGYFTFFMRKHDSGQRTVVLRADKLLTTSLMNTVSVRDRIQDPSEIYPLLNTFGTRFIVIEDRPSGSVVLDWLRAELTTDRFIERARIPIESDDRRLRNVPLIVYEYLDATRPDPQAAVDIDIPLVGRHVHVPLAELVGTAGF
jgi:4-amino-4-deoxy-L-arabinose transferase-like glycosyltransferase